MINLLQYFPSVKALTKQKQMFEEAFEREKDASVAYKKTIQGMQDIIVQKDDDNNKLHDRVVALEEAAKAQQEVIDSLTDKMEGKVRGTAPWFVLKARDTSEAEGVFMEMDWNQTFIEYLKEQTKMPHAEPDTLVKRWLMFLYDDLIQELENQETERNSANGTSPLDIK